MSNLQLVPASSCDDLLDYIYGGLSPARIQTFEEHLPTCDKCRAEVEATKKIRNLTRETLPPVEPSNDRMAAISAQLLHAAAQRKAPRAPMYRRIFEHPGFAAMAAMLVVGLFVTTQWSNLKMPAKQMESAPAAPVTAPAAATPTPASAPAPTATPEPAAIPVEQKPAESTALQPKAPAPALDPKALSAFEGRTKAPETDKSIAEKTLADEARERSDAKGKVAATKELYATKKDAPSDAELWSRTEKKKAKSDDFDGLSASTGDSSGGGQKAGSGSVSTGPSSVTTSLAKPAPTTPSPGYFRSGAGTGADNNRNNTGTTIAAGGEGTSSSDYRKQQEAPRSAPAQAAKPMAKAELAEEKPAKAANRANNEPAPAAPPPPVAQAPAAAPSNAYGQETQLQGNFSNLGKSRDAGASTAESLRRRGESLARAGKCAEALRSYNDANRIAPNADNNAADQLTYARCLRESGQLDAAQMALDNLQRQRVQSNAIAVENEVQVLNAQRRSSGAPSGTKASKAAPKRAAPAATEKAADSAVSY